MLSCSVRFSAPSFWMGGGLESRCVGRVYGADAPSAPYTRPIGERLVHETFTYMCDDTRGCVMQF